MASLSTCHLGLWLGWQILLNIVKLCPRSPREDMREQYIPTMFSPRDDMREQNTPTMFSPREDMREQYILTMSTQSQRRHAGTIYSHYVYAVPEKTCGNNIFPQCSLPETTRGDYVFPLCSVPQMIRGDNIFPLYPVPGMTRGDNIFPLQCAPAGLAKKAMSESTAQDDKMYIDVRCVDGQQ